MMEAAATWTGDGNTTWWIKRNPFSKAWGLQPAGDLWELVREAYLSRGTKAQCLTKVKGHATDEQVNSGEVEEHHKKGNDKTDQLADDVVKEHGEEVT